VQVCFGAMETCAQGPSCVQADQFFFTQCRHVPSAQVEVGVPVVFTQCRHVQKVPKLRAVEPNKVFDSGLGEKCVVVCSGL